MSVFVSSHVVRSFICCFVCGSSSDRLRTCSSIVVVFSLDLLKGTSLHVESVGVSPSCSSLTYY